MAYMRIRAIKVKQDLVAAASDWKIPEQFHQAFPGIWLIACSCHEKPQSNDPE
jgi:hypothetical protein